MTVKECYEKLEGDYNDALQRLLSETLIKKFLVKFLADKSFADLEAALEKNDTEIAFRAAHTLKGVCSNLSFKRLFESAYSITEYLRSGDIENAKVIFPKVKQDYELVVSTINEFNGSN